MIKGDEFVRDSFSAPADLTGQPRSRLPINAYLRALPPLREAAKEHHRAAIQCKMCGGKVDLFACVDFNTPCDREKRFEPTGVLVDYYRCSKCDFLFTTFCDTWTARDFSELIYNDDYLIVDGEFLGERAQRTAAALAPTIAGAEDERILDYGSGSGAFGHALDALGFPHTSSYDPYTHPERPGGRFAIVTAFDVIEHSADPVATLHDMLSLMADGGCILIGQTLQPDDIEEKRGDWWYMAPRNGHISLFSEETIRAYAEKTGLLFDNFGAMFALSRPNRTELTKRIIARNAPIDRRRFLYAPGRLDGEPFGWHPLEREPEFSFRWTGHDEVDLGHVEIEGECELVIPVHIALKPDHLEQARLKIGDVVLPLRHRRSSLTARFATDRRIRFAATLLTPPPERPVESNGQDTRRMGIAVIACEESALPLRKGSSGS